MTSFLQEERRLEQMMYRQSICSESDSNQGESRDSGVELDRGHHDDISWPNHNHSRQDSEVCFILSFLFLNIYFLFKFFLFY